MVEENQDLEVIKEEVKPVKNTKSFKADFIADIYAFFHQTSSTGEKVGSFEVNSKTSDYFFVDEFGLFKPDGNSTSL